MKALRILSTSLIIFAGICSWNAFAADRDSLHETPPAPQFDTSDASVLLGKPTLTLADPGQAPHHRLSFRFEQGQSFALTLRMKSELTLTTNNKKNPKVESPWIRIPLVLQVAAVKPSGSAHVGLRIQHPQIEENGASISVVGDAIDPVLSDLSAGSCEFEIDVHGAVSDLDCDYPGFAGSAMNQLYKEGNPLVGRIALLPAEAVGLGAQWELHLPSFKAGLLRTSLTANMRLTEVGQDSAAIAVQLKHRILPQEFALPSSGGTVLTAELLHGAGQGKGTLKLAFNRPIPSFELSGRFTQSIKILDSKSEEIQTELSLEIQTREVSAGS